MKPVLCDKEKKKIHVRDRDWNQQRYVEGVNIGHHKE